MLGIKIDSALKQFLSHFEFDTLRDQPDMEQLEEAGLLRKQKLLAGALPGISAIPPDWQDEGGGGGLEIEELPLALASDANRQTIDSPESKSDDTH